MIQHRRKWRNGLARKAARAAPKNFRYFSYATSGSMRAILIVLKPVPAQGCHPYLRERPVTDVCGMDR
jgi:hypothetical protein